MSTAVAGALQLPQYINGQWVESTATEWLDVPNPATGEALATRAARGRRRSKCGG